jgi:FemAB-related protein (PEP-CTERM system-associated)
MQPAIAATDAANPEGSPQASPPLQIAEFSDTTAWNTFLSENAGTFYHRHEWAGINQAELGHRSHMLAATLDGRIAGVLPLTLVSSRLFGRILCSMPFVNYGGPVARDPDVVRRLADEASRLARELRADSLELRCAAPLDTTMPASTRKISMTIALQSDPEAVFAKFTSKHRTNIRRSIKNGLAVKSGGIELLPVFFAVMEQSWKALGTPLYSRRYFQRILETFPANTRIFVCSRGEDPVAVAFNGEFNGVIEGMWAGGTPASRALQANYALYWEMMQDACRRGFQRFHLGRSTADSGAEDFKKKWNAEALQLYWYQQRPDGRVSDGLNPDNPKFKLAIAAWRRMPTWMTRLIGPSIARGIP